MPTYAIKAPNGQTYQIDGPEGATDEQVRAEVMRQYPETASGAPASTPKPPAPETLGSTLIRAAKNLPMDTVLTLKGAMQQFGPDGLPAQAIMHPIKTAQGIGEMAGQAADILKGGIQHTRDLSPAEFQGSAPRMDTAAYDKFTGDLKEKYGTKQGIYKEVGDHPAGTLLTIASVLDPALRAAKVDGGVVGATARTADAVASRIPTVIPKARPVTPVPSVAELKNSATQLYTKAKKAGVVIDKGSFKSFANDLVGKFADEPMDETLTPKTVAAMKRIQNTKGDVSLNQLELLRRVAGTAAETVDKTDRRLARMLVDHIDDYAQNLQPNNIIAGDAPKAVALLNEARSTWQKAARGEQIDKLIEKAKAAGGALKTNLDSSLRAQFKKLANNDRGMSRFTPEQQDAIRKVAFGDGPVHSVMHAAGRVIPSNPVGAAATGGLGAAAHVMGAPVTGPVGVAIGAAGVAGKVGSTVKTVKNAQKASEIARGSTAYTDAYKKIQARRAARTARKTRLYGVP